MATIANLKISCKGEELMMIRWALLGEAVEPGQLGQPQIHKATKIFVDLRIIS